MALPYVTKFEIEDKYSYLKGLGNHHQSEAAPGAVPDVNNHPNLPPYDLKTEKITGTSFTAYPRAKNIWSYLYRIRTSYDHGKFEPYNHHLESGNPSPAKHLNPNGHFWPTFDTEQGDWLSQRLLAANGNVRDKIGMSLWLFHINQDMAVNQAFASQDGEACIVPQSGALDIQTEFGKMLVRQNEIAVIPRGVRYRVTLPSGRPARGYVLELYQGHFQLPELGIIGTTGLAGQRDFQVPTADFQGKIETRGEMQIAVPIDDTSTWTIIHRLDTKLWVASQPHTPFNVVGWLGSLYPYKYDVKKFSYITNVNFDHADPSLFVVLTAPAFGKAPGTAVVDIAIAQPRWNTAGNTLCLPWFHRNTATEFVAPIIAVQDPEFALNNSNKFAPFGGWLNNGMVPHGSNDEEYVAAQSTDTNTAQLMLDNGITAAMFETESALLLTDWAMEQSQLNFKSQNSVVFDV